MSNNDLIDRLKDEGDLCKNEGADDIAALLWEAAAALSSGQAASAVPEGWKLVPINPTPEMIAAADAGDREYTRRCFGPSMPTMQQSGEDHWSAMLEAAPTQPASAPAKEGVSDDLGTLAGIRRMEAEQSPPAPREPSIEPVPAQKVVAWHNSERTWRDPSKFRHSLTFERLADSAPARATDGFTERPLVYAEPHNIPTPSLAAPASAGVEEFPLPEHEFLAMPRWVREYADKYARAVLRSYSASLGLQARTEGSGT